MLYVMQNNFALFDVVYWARGVDIYAIFDTIREAVLSNPEMTVDDFFDILYRQFLPLRIVGHFSVISTSLHYLYNDPVWQQYFSFRANARLREPHVMAFYVPLYAQDNDGWLYEAVASQMMRTEQEIRSDRARRFGRLAIRGEVELAEEYLQAYINGDILEVLRLMPYVNEALSDNVTTRILEDERIAYLVVDSFFSNHIPRDEERQIHTFYDEIRDFDHLIIYLDLMTEALLHGFMILY